MHVFDGHARYQVDRGKVPNAFDAGFHHALGDFLRGAPAGGDHADIDRILADKRFKLRTIEHRLAVDLLADQFRVHIEQRKHLKPCGSEPFEICKRMADVARADDHNGMIPVKRQDRFNLGKQRADIVSVPLLAKSAEAVEILPYLRCVEAHLLRKFFR